MSSSNSKDLGLPPNDMVGNNPDLLLNSLLKLKKTSDKLQLSAIKDKYQKVLSFTIKYSNTKHDNYPDLCSLNFERKEPFLNREKRIFHQGISNCDK